MHFGRLPGNPMSTLALPDVLINAQSMAQPIVRRHTLADTPTAIERVNPPEVS
jgi:hypothetical protein